jgi:hypothetical protein
MRQPARPNIVVAFSRTDHSELVPAYPPMRFETAEDAVSMARYLAGKCAGVLAWSREIDIADSGPPRILFQTGDVLPWNYFGS